MKSFFSVPPTVFWLKKGNSNLRVWCVLFLSLSLFACSGGYVKRSNQMGVSYKQFDQVKVKSEVLLNFKKAISLMQQDKNKQAIVILKQVIKQEQRLPAPFINLGIAYNKIGDTKAAEMSLANALRLDPSNPITNNELGLVYRKMGKFSAARMAYEKAITSSPNYLPAIRNLGVLCDLYMHDFRCALKQFESYLKLKPDDKKVLIWVADVKRQLKK